MSNQTVIEITKSVKDKKDGVGASPISDFLTSVRKEDGLSDQMLANQFNIPSRQLAYQWRSGIAEMASFARLMNCLRHGGYDVAITITKRD